MKSIKERLTEYAYGQWSIWMWYMFDKGTFNEDGSWTMPKHCVDRWRRQFKTHYSELSIEERRSDMTIASNINDILTEWLNKEVT